MSALELRIPPPVVAIVTGGLMWLLARSLPAWTLAFPGKAVLAAVAAAAGMAFIASAILQFRRRETTVNPLKPAEATALVAQGPFRFTRNPMYLGLTLLLSAWALWLAHGAALLLLPVFVLYLTRFQIVPEERALAIKFGAAYAEYCNRVRRWI